MMVSLDGFGYVARGENHKKSLYKTYGDGWVIFNIWFLWPLDGWFGESPLE